MFVERNQTPVSNPLTMLFRKFIEEAVIPESWKQANISAIFKKEIVRSQKTTGQSVLPLCRVKC